MIGCIIQARLTSTRLPRKHLLPLDGVPLLEHLVRRAHASEYINKVVIAAPHSPECCLNEEIFIGSEHDVLDRYYQCANKYKMDAIVRLTADCPLVPVYEINRVIERYLEGDTHYVTNIRPPAGPLEYHRFGNPDGWDVECFSFSALEDAWAYAEHGGMREHVTGFLKANEEFNPIFLEPLKLSVDTQADYERLKEFYRLEQLTYQPNMETRN